MENRISKYSHHTLLENIYTSKNYNHWVRFCNKQLKHYHIDNLYTGIDIMQELAEKILSGERTIKEDIKIENSLFLIIKSLIHNHAKHHINIVSPVYNNDALIENNTLENIAKVTPPAYSHIEYKELRNIVFNTCRSEEEKSVLNLMLDNKNCAEIAGKLRITPVRARKIRRRIRKRVEDSLE